jgi:hypothetical protein
MKKIFYLILIFTINYISAQKTVTTNLYVYDELNFDVKINFQLKVSKYATLQLFDNQIKFFLDVKEDSLIIKGNYNTGYSTGRFIETKIINIQKSENINLTPIYLFTQNFIPDGSCVRTFTKKYLFGLIKIKKKIPIMCPEEIGSFNKIYDSKKNSFKFLDKDNKEIEYFVKNNQIIIDCKKLIIK